MSERLPLRPPVTLGDLADALNGKLIGNGEIQVSALVHPTEVSRADHLVFVMEPALVSALEGSPVLGAVVAEDICLPQGLLEGVVRVQRPRYALADLLEIFASPVDPPPGVHPSAIVDASAMIYPAVSIGPFVHVGPDASVGSGSILMSHVSVGASARIGENCLLHSGVRIGERVCIGNRVIIHHNASVGADGFSFVTPEQASFEAAKTGGDFVTTNNRGIRRINSIGTVVIGDDVEIGAGTTIDRARFDRTEIGEGTKIDNLVQIGHNVLIGKYCLIVAQVGVAGSTVIEDQVIIGGQAGISGHLSIGRGSMIAAKAGISKTLPPKSYVAGVPALPIMLDHRLNALRKRLPDLFRDFEELDAAVKKLFSKS